MARAAAAALWSRILCMTHGTLPDDDAIVEARESTFVIHPHFEESVPVKMLSENGFVSELCQMTAETLINSAISSLTRNILDRYEALALLCPPSPAWSQVIRRQVHLKTQCSTSVATRGNYRSTAAPRFY